MDLITWCGWPLEVHSQHYGAWRVAYGDSARLNEDLPALMNPLPLQYGYRAERAPVSIRQVPEENRLEVSLADLSPGIYLARITIGDKIVVRKFIRMAE